MNYIIHLENNVLDIKGATKVVSSTPSQAIIEVGELSLTICGNGIEVKSLNLEESNVCFIGKFTDIKLGTKTKKQPFLKRIFK